MKKWVEVSRPAEYHARLCESSDSSGAEFSRLIKIIIIIMTGILIIINIITILIILTNPSSRQGYNTTTE